MASTLSSVSANPYIQSLHDLLEAAPSPVEWLVIAHQDPTMVGSLSAALWRESAAVLEVSQHDWEFEGGELSQAIEWALQEANIKQIVLAGHSQIRPTGWASLAGKPKSDTASSSSSSLLSEVQQANALSQESQQIFASQVDQMYSLPPVREKLTAGELQCYGLFYRAESGVFLFYNSNASSFEPLVP